MKKTTLLSLLLLICVACSERVVHEALPLPPSTHKVVLAEQPLPNPAPPVEEKPPGRYKLELEWVECTAVTESRQCWVRIADGRMILTGGVALPGQKFTMEKKSIRECGIKYDGDPL